MLNVIMLQFRYAEFRYAECRVLCVFEIHFLVFRKVSGRIKGELGVSRLL
jgi:hypothetical protein